MHDSSGKLAVGKWHQCFDKKLGEPVGAVAVSGAAPGCNAGWLDPTAPLSVRSAKNCTFVREFQFAAVTFDGETNRGSIKWAGDGHDVDPAHSCDTA